MSRHMYEDELRHLSELVEAGDTVTKSLQRKLSAKFGFDFGRARIDFRLREMGVMRKRMYSPEVRARFLSLVRDNPSRPTRALLSLFERATGDSVDYNVARYWRNSEAA